MKSSLLLAAAATFQTTTYARPAGWSAQTGAESRPVSDKDAREVMTGVCRDTRLANSSPDISAPGVPKSLWELLLRLERRGQSLAPFHIHPLIPRVTKLKAVDNVENSADKLRKGMEEDQKAACGGFSSDREDDTAGETTDADQQNLGHEKRGHDDDAMGPAPGPSHGQDSVYPALQPVPGPSHRQDPVYPALEPTADSPRDRYDDYTFDSDAETVVMQSSEDEMMEEPNPPQHSNKGTCKDDTAARTSGGDDIGRGTRTMLDDDMHQDSLPDDASSCSKLLDDAARWEDRHTCSERVDYDPKAKRRRVDKDECVERPAAASGRDTLT